MKKKERAEAIGAILDQMLPDPPIPLDHRDPFTLLCAVVLSAQCTDVRVNKTTPDLFALANTPEAMAKLDPQVVEEIIRPCGLAPAKSKALVGLSKIIVEKHQGVVPDRFEELEELPGVGHKTASVVMNHAFGSPAFPVDTHIHRLAWRWKLSSGRSVKETERDLKAVWPEESWGRRHLQMIYFGRQWCPARGHKAEECPICSLYGRKELFRSK